jgi:AcrR family transcriptional regulator
VGATPRFSQERKQQILQAAAGVIAERGLADTRVADVAASAGTSAALLIYYFESKERLLTEALTYAEDRFYLEAWHRLSEVDSARDRLASIIEFSVPGSSPVEDTHDWPLWIELWTRALHDDDAARRRGVLDRRWRSTIADIVRSGQRAAEFADDVDAELFAIKLAALLDGLAVQVVLKDGEVTPKRMLGLALETVERDLGVKYESRAGAVMRS